MSEQPTESAPESVEPQELPTPEISPASVDQPTSAAPDLNALAAALKDTLLPELDERIARQTQSTKDRRLGKFDKRLGEIESVLADYQQLVAGGADPDAATDKVLLRELASRLQQDSPASVPQPGTLGAETMQTARSILRDKGLSENDPEVLAFFSGRYASDLDFIAKLSDFAAKKEMTSSLPVSPATVSAPGGGAPAASDQESLMQQYKQESARVGRGPKQIAVRRKYRELGLDI